PSQSVAYVPSSPACHMPTEKGVGKPAARANSSSWWIGFMSPEAPWYRTKSVRVTGPTTQGAGGGGTLMPLPPARSCLLCRRFRGLHAGQLRLGHEPAGLVAKLGDHHGEGQLAAAPALLGVDLGGVRLARQPGPRPRRWAEEGVFLLGVQAAFLVEFDRGPGIGVPVLPEKRRGQERRRNDRPFAVEISGIRGKSGPGEFADFSALDVHFKRRAPGTDGVGVDHGLLLVTQGCWLLTETTSPVMYEE